jgi:hypothetical protein
MPSNLNKQLEYFAKPSKLTSAGKYIDTITDLPNDIQELTGIVQGLCIHLFTSLSFYGYTIPEVRTEEAHIRNFEKMLEKIIELDSKPLTKARKVEKKLVGVCHHFAKILTSILRAKKIPARMRYGFGSYFNSGFYEDHSVCEYWNQKESRWVIVDPQFDNIWKKKLSIKHNVLDVPRNLFLTPADGWILSRQGKVDPNKFGIFQGNMRGLWFLAGNLVKDLASINKMEMLQWDAWTGMPRPNNSMQNKKTLVFFDELANLMSDIENNFDTLQKFYNQGKNSVHVPDRVFNALHRHLEWVFKEPPQPKNLSKKKTNGKIV